MNINPYPEWLPIKQFTELTIQDFISHPIWVNCHTEDNDEEWYEETDEESYRPLINREDYNPSDLEYLVKAIFRLSDGTTLNGFFTPQNTENNEDGISYIQPQVFIDQRRYMFWFGIGKPEEGYLKSFYDDLKKNPDETFPITYISDENATKLKIVGIINGFGWIDSKE